MVSLEGSDSRSGKRAIVAGDRAIEVTHLLESCLERDHLRSS